MLVTAAQILWITATLPAQAPAPPQAAPAPMSIAKLPLLAPGSYSLKLARDNRPTIDYAISIPRTYVAGRPVPLILALHFGGNPRGAGRSLMELLVKPTLDELGAIIIAPDALGAGWNAPENEAAALALVDAAMNGYSVDPRKILVTGFSMGGIGTWHFGNAHAARFSAAIPIAGRPSGDVDAWKLPVFAVHSRADDVVPIAPTETRIKELTALGKNAKLVVLDDVPHHDVSRYESALRQAVPWVQAIWK